jgi:hypothetical protein
LEEDAVAQEISACPAVHLPLDQLRLGVDALSAAVVVFARGGVRRPGRERDGSLRGGLPDEQPRLLAEVAIQAGLRWGELIEPRRGDPDPPTRMLTIERTAVELRPTFHPSGGRFQVKDYPKNRHFRRIKLSHALVIRLTAFAMARSLGSDDPLFTAPAVPCRPSVRERPDPGNLGATETECSRAPIPARDVDRVLDGPVPVWSLPGRLRPLPGDAPRGR